MRKREEMVEASETPVSKTAEPLFSDRDREMLEAHLRERSGPLADAVNNLLHDHDQSSEGQGAHPRTPSQSDATARLGATLPDTEIPEGYCPDCTKELEPNGYCFECRQVVQWTVLYGGLVYGPFISRATANEWCAKARATKARVAPLNRPEEGAGQC